jgi:feruloyl esterase
MVVDYHEATVAQMGGAEAAEHFIRLYMLPGVHHCRGDPGSDLIGGSGGDAPVTDARHDLLTALEQWVERGRTPQAMIAPKMENDAVVRTRLICPYPQRSRYRGGNPDKAASFVCVSPDKLPSRDIVSTRSPP